MGGNRIDFPPPGSVTVDVHIAPSGMISKMCRQKWHHLSRQRASAIQNDQESAHSGWTDREQENKQMWGCPWTVHGPGVGDHFKRLTDYPVCARCHRYMTSHGTTTPTGGSLDSFYSYAIPTEPEASSRCPRRRSTLPDGGRPFLLPSMSSVLHHGNASTDLLNNFCSAFWSNADQRRDLLRIRRFALRYTLGFPLPAFLYPS